MKNLIVIGGILIASVSFGQRIPDVHGPWTGPDIRPGYLTALTTQPVKMFDGADIAGSPYLSEEYKPGYVKVKNGYSQYNVPVRFNIYTNEIEFKISQPMVLDSMDMVMYLDVPGDSASLKLFKTGYPEVGENKKTTIYEVLSIGEKAHLLKYSTQKVEKKEELRMTSKEKELVTTSTLYIFNPRRNTIIKVKNSKDQLIIMFPNLTSAIEKIIKEKDLNLKKESDLGELITDLNNVQ